MVGVLSQPISAPDLFELLDAIFLKFPGKIGGHVYAEFVRHDRRYYPLWIMPGGLQETKWPPNHRWPA